MAVSKGLLLLGVSLTGNGLLMRTIITANSLLAELLARCSALISSVGAMVMCSYLTAN